MNKKSAIPLYQQMSDNLKRKIESGELKENDRLKTEQELSAEYNVSRITVRKAIEILVEEGLIVKKQGIGTFIAARKLNRVMDRVLSFSEQCERDGHVPSTELISVEWIKPDPGVVAQLRMEDEEKVLRIVRVRKSDGEPVMLEYNYYPEEYEFLLSGNLLGSTYESIRSHGIIPVHAIKTVEICYANDMEKECLKVEKGQALLLHKDTVFQEDGTPIHFSKLIINPDRYRLTYIM